LYPQGIEEEAGELQALEMFLARDTPGEDQPFRIAVAIARPAPQVFAFAVAIEPKPQNAVRHAIEGAIHASNKDGVTLPLLLKQQ
jgi:hypothetical protein